MILCHGSQSKLRHLLVINMSIIALFLQSLTSLMQRRHMFCFLTSKGCLANTGVIHLDCLTQSLRKQVGGGKQNKCQW